MILLVTPSERGPEWAAALQEATGQEVVTVETLAGATTLLRARSCALVVLDQSLLETEPHEEGTMLTHLGTALLVQVNLAISGMQRLVYEVKAAMERRRREELAAREATTGALKCEFNGTLTALLLSVELVLETPTLTPAATERLQRVRELVTGLCQQLEYAGVTGKAVTVATSSGGAGRNRTDV